MKDSFSGVASFQRSWLGGGGPAGAASASYRYAVEMELVMPLSVRTHRHGSGSAPYARGHDLGGRLGDRRAGAKQAQDGAAGDQGLRPRRQLEQLNLA